MYFLSPSPYSLLWLLFLMLLLLFVLPSSPLFSCVCVCVCVRGDNLHVSSHGVTLPSSPFYSLSLCTPHYPSPHLRPSDVIHVRGLEGQVMMSKSRGCIREKFPQPIFCFSPPLLSPMACHEDITSQPFSLINLHQRQAQSS